MNSPKVIKSYEVQPNRKLLFISLSFALILSILPWLAPSVSADTGNGSCAQAPNFTKDIGFGSQVAFTTARQPQGIVMHDLSAAPAQGLVPQSVYNHPTWDDWGDTGKITLDKDGYVYAAPQPWQSLLDNPPSAARKILRVDTDTGVMTEWLSLPATAHPPTTANPYAVLGLAYDCENHMLYVADISGSTDVAVNGQIYAIDIATATVVDTFDDVDALGLGVSDVSGTKKLYYGDGHTNKIRSINLDAAGNFTGAAVDEVTVPQTNMRAGDITFQPDGKMLFPESQFSFNLSGWGYHAQDSYRYEYVNGAWSQDIQVAPGQPNHPRSSMPGAEYDPVNEFFWFTSNAVHFPTPYIYGASGFAAGDSLLNNADATYLDYTTVNNNIKAYLGDIQMAHRFMTLGNYVWVDSNADGLQTPGEAPVPGVTLYLYLDGSSTTNSINSSTNVPSANQPGFPPNGDLDPDDRLIATAVTDASGHYTFTGLVAGDYIVSVVPPAGYTNTGNADPAGADPDDNVPNDSNFVAGENHSHPITMVYNQEPSPNPDNPNFNDANYTVDFGFIPPPSIDIEKLTNNNQADGANDADVPVIAPGDPVQWTYIIKNEASVPIALNDIDVVDNILGNLMLNGVLQAGVTYSDNTDILDGTLGGQETFTIVVSDVAENMGAITSSSSASDEYVSGCDNGATAADESVTTYENTATVSFSGGQDTDDSHYCNPPPSIDIEKTTNGEQADGSNDADVPAVAPGAAIEWIYTITNDGLVDIPRADIQVSDNVVGNLVVNGAIQALAAPYTGASFANDSAILDNVLSPNESFTIRVTRTAEDLGAIDADSSAADEYVAGCNDPATAADETSTAYENSATVTIPLDNDSDDSHYCNPPPSIDIEKTTNGNQADGANDADVPAIAPGAAVTWSYLVTNNGDVSIVMSDVDVTDNVVGDLMIDGALQALGAPYGGATFSNNAQIGDGILGPNETFTLEVTWTAPDIGGNDPAASADDEWVLGCDDGATGADESITTYHNNATVTIPLDTDNDDSHFCNTPPSIEIEKLTNGNQADNSTDADVPVVNPGDPITWSYIVTNDGTTSIPLSDVNVSDNVIGVLMNDGALQALAAPYTGATFGNNAQIGDGVLGPNESFTIEVSRPAEAVNQQDAAASADDEYVTGCDDAATALDETRSVYENSTTVTIPTDTDSDDSHYCNPMPSIDIEKLTNGNQADGASGSDVPVVSPGDVITWTYIVLNDGTTDIALTDIDVTDNVVGNLMNDGILAALGAPYTGVSYADNTSIQDGVLGAGESFTLLVSRFAEDLGAEDVTAAANDEYILGCNDPATASDDTRITYMNSATVEIPLDQDSDDSHYCNPLPSIEIEKYTNDNQADGANDSDVPEVLPGATITWTYMVVNDGDVTIPMSDVDVADNVVGTLVTAGAIQNLAAPYGGATYSDNADIVDGFLAAGESFSIEVTWTAPDMGAINAAAADDEWVLGCDDGSTAEDETRTVYENTASVTIPFDSDSDDSHFCNPLPNIDIEKLTNGSQADSANGIDVPVVNPGDAIEWTYLIANYSGVSIPMSDIDVDDNVIGDLMIGGALQAVAAPHSGPTFGDNSQIGDNILNPGETFTLLVTWIAPDLGTIDHAANADDAWILGCDDGSTDDDESRTTYMNRATVAIQVDIDSDDSHFCSPTPSIEIEKLTNGSQADGANDADVPVVNPGAQIDWTFIVTNDGDVSIPMEDVTVNDNVVGDLMIDGGLQALAAPYTGATFSDNSQIGDNVLQPGESFTLLVSRAAEDLGTESAMASISDEYVAGCDDPATAEDESRITYENSATVTIPQDEDTDDSHYCNPEPSIDVEKTTNGNQADGANDSDVPVIVPGTPVEWIYTVTNDGDVSIQLADINVGDNVVGDLMIDGVLVSLANPYTGVSYDINADIQDGILGAGESFTLSVLRSAEDMGMLDLNAAVDDQHVAGCNDPATAADETRITYMNSVTVTIPLDEDLDDSHYCNPEPSIDIEKLTNGNQADGANDSDVPELLPGDEVVWSFIVLNDGDVTIPLTDVSVTDDVVGDLMNNGTLQALSAPYTGTTYIDNSDVADGFLAVGESFTLQVVWTAPDMGAEDAATDPADEFVLGCDDPATADDESRTIYENSAVVTIPMDSDSDDSHFCNPESSIDIEKLTNGNQADGASGADVPEILPGDPITWTYIIANYSDVSIAMSDIDVNDNVVGDLMIAGALQALGTPYGGVIFGDDSQVLDGVLGSNETFTLLATWTAPDMGQIDPNADANDEWVLGCDDGATPADESRITYENRATVITPLDSDSDDSHVCNPVPSIEIEKLTNGNQADDANHSDVPVLTPGEVVTWTYIIANDGDISIPLSDVDVNDNVIGDLMINGGLQTLAAPYAGATFGDDSQILDGMLSAGEAFTLTVSRTAEDLGLESDAAAIDDEYVMGCDDLSTDEVDESRITYMNSAMVSIPLDMDSDDSHYCNPMPSIEIEKLTNGNQADGANDADVPVLNPNDGVEWLYIVTNDGDVSIAMSDVDVSDNVIGTLMQDGILSVLGNPYVGTSYADDAAIADDLLAPGESFTLAVNSTAEDLGLILASADAGAEVVDQYVMGCDDGSTEASEARTIYENSAIVTIPHDTDQDDSHYCNPLPSIAIEKLTNGNQADSSADADVPVIAPGDAVTWRYIVTNDGPISIPLLDIDVVDSVIGSLMQGGQLVVLSAPYQGTAYGDDSQIIDGVLGVGESFVIEVTSIAQDLSIEDVDAVDTDQYVLGCDGLAADDANERITYMNSAMVSIPLDNDSDDSHYCNPLASIGDVVWYDDDRDGVQDAGELGVEGVTVNLLDESGQIIGTTVTDADGAYLFDNLEADIYSIQFVTNTLPAEYVISPQDAGNDDAVDSDADPTTGETAQTDLSPGEHDPTWDMGIYQQVASIGDTVWFDANADGIQDPNEDGVENVTVNLYSVDDSGNETLVGTTSTDANGYYEFTDLEPGDYFVEFVPPTGYEISPQNSGADDAVDSDIDPATGQTEVTTIDPGEHDPTWDAGIYIPSSIGDYVWYDENQDGVQDAWETGVAGVDVTLYDAAGTPIAVTQTDADGYYLFDNLMPGDYYLGFGLPNGYTQSPTDANNNPGEEDVYDSDPDQVTQLTPVTTLDPGEHDPTWDMGIYLSDGSIPASIGDYVWFDANADGVQDASESGISGVTVTLYDGDGNAVAQDVTDSSGYYGFENLAPGDYYVEFSPPAGYLPTSQDSGGDDASDSDMDPATGMTEVTTLDPGEHDPTWDAGFFLETIPASIGDTVWFDSNADGIQDADESGIAGVTVDLYNVDANGNEVLVATTVTNDDGYYEFINLVPGDYFVEFTPPAAYLPSPQNSGADDAVDSDMDPLTGLTEVTTLDPSEHDPTWDAGFHLGDPEETQPASIGDTVWYDTNHDGIQDADETGVEDITVILYNELGEPVATTTTDADGYYEFTNLVPGDYFVEFVPPTSYMISPQDAAATGAGADDEVDSDMDSGTGRTILTTLDPGENDPSWDAGIYQVASIGDTVWYDSNTDGIQDADESGIEGVTVQLYDANGDLVDETTTDADGYYEFTDLNPGDYSVTFVPPAGFIISPQNAGDDDAADSDADPETGATELTTLDPNEHDPTWDAGLYQLASIGDTVWHDVDADGVQDAGESGIPGVTVQLYDANGDLVDETTTDADGNYEFNGLQPGDYSVTFVPPAGFIISPQNAGSDDTADSDADPETGATELTTLDPIEHDPTWDAGLYQLASIGDTVWYDADQDGVQDASETGIPGTNTVLGVPGVLVTLYSVDSSGNEIAVATQTTDSSGHYEFTDLIPGDYVVGFEMPNGYELSPSDTGSDDFFDSDVDAETMLTPVTMLSSGEHNPTLDMGIYLSDGIIPASIGDTVWFDSNADGLQDADEAGLQDVIVTLLDESGNVIAETTTDANGEYSFTNLNPGSYAVQFTPPSGFLPSPQNMGDDDSIDSDMDPISGRTIVTMLDSGENDPTWDAGFYMESEPASIGNYVWLDLNDNGLQDANESGVPGVHVTLYTADGTPVADMVTSSDGYYFFDNLVPGDYYVEFETPSGYTLAQQNVGNDSTIDSDVNPLTGRTIVTTLEAGQSDLTWDAGLTIEYQTDGNIAVRPLPGALGDTVWLDANKDGVQDAGEVGVPNVIVKLYDSDGEILATTQTDEQGNYLFNNLVPGDYYIEFVTPADYIITQHNQGVPTTDSDADPETGRTTKISLQSGITDLTWDAGIYPISSHLDGNIWLDVDEDALQDANESDFENIEVVLYTEDGRAVQTVETDENGYYIFENVETGNYFVQYNLPVGYRQYPDNRSSLVVSLDINNRSQLISHQATEPMENLNVPLLLIPSSVDLSSFTVDRVEDASGSKLIVNWSTSAELGTAGFHILRTSDGTLSGAHQVTTQMIPGKGSAGGTYSIVLPYDETVDPPLDQLSFWLYEVEFSGTINHYGPARVDVYASQLEQFMFLPFMGQQ